MTVNRRWTLARRPMGRVAIEDFALIEEPFDAPTLRSGELLVRNRVFAIAPTIRNWLNPPGRSDRGSIPIGEAIAGMAGCGGGEHGVVACWTGGTVATVSGVVGRVGKSRRYQPSRRSSGGWSPCGVSASAGMGASHGPQLSLG